MMVRALLQLVAGLTLAFVMVVGWTSPSEAHGGHDAAATSQAYVETAADPAPRSPDELVVESRGAAEQSASASEPDCAGHGKSSGSAGRTCCGNTCHAVMSTEFGLPDLLSLSTTVSPHAPEPSALQAPTVHIKRPPRRLAALVG